MSIVPEKVRGRNNQLFGDIKKDISISLAQVREFITTVSQSKKSTRGFKSTCEQIEAFLTNCNKSFEVVQKRINGARGFVDAADSIDYNDDIDMMNGGVVEKLTRGVRNIEKYLMHFNKMVAAGETPKAALSIAKYKKDIVRVIDKTKEYNIKSEAAIRAYLASEQFLTALLHPESTIDITKGDLQGTEAAKKKFLLDIQERASKQGHRVELEDEDNFFIEQADGKIAPIAADDDDDDADNDDDKPVVEEDFNVAEKNDDDDDDDEDASSDRRKKKTTTNESRESDGDDDDDDGDDCDASTTSDGGALFEGNIERENAAIVDEVEKTAYVVGGRTLRNNGRLQGYADVMKHNPDLRVGDYAESAPKKKSSTKRDETREYDSEISDSDADGAVDEVTAHIKQIEEERARAAKKAKAAAAAAAATTTTTTTTTNGTKVKKEKRVRDDDNDGDNAAAAREQPQPKEARTTELSNGSSIAPGVKVKQEHVIMRDD